MGFQCLTENDVARVDLQEGQLKVPDSAEGLALEAPEDGEADDAGGDRIRCHLIELQPRAVQHLQREQRPWSHVHVCPCQRAMSADSSAAPGQRYTPTVHYRVATARTVQRLWPQCHSSSAVSPSSSLLAEQRSCYDTRCQATRTFCAEKPSPAARFSNAPRQRTPTPMPPCLSRTDTYTFCCKSCTARKLHLRARRRRMRRGRRSCP